MWVHGLGEFKRALVNVERITHTSITAAPQTKKMQKVTVCVHSL